MDPSRKAEIVIDAREFEPPEPFVQTLAALDRLGDNEKLLLLLCREPLPLYRALQLNGFGYFTNEAADGTFEILIWRA